MEHDKAFLRRVRKMESEWPTEQAMEEAKRLDKPHKFIMGRWVNFLELSKRGGDALTTTSGLIVVGFDDEEQASLWRLKFGGRPVDEEE